MKLQVVLGFAEIIQLPFNPQLSVRHRFTVKHEQLHIEQSHTVNISKLCCSQC